MSNLPNHVLQARPGGKTEDIAVPGPGALRPHMLKKDCISSWTMKQDCKGPSESWNACCSQPMARQTYLNHEDPVPIPAGPDEAS